MATPVRRFRVRIDLERLRRSLSREDGALKSLEQVLAFLRDAGFQPQPDGSWIVREADLGHLRPEEVTEARPLDPGPPGLSAHPFRGRRNGNGHAAGNGDENGNGKGTGKPNGD